MKRIKEVDLTRVKSKMWDVDDHYNVVEVNVSSPFKEGDKVKVTIEKLTDGEYNYIGQVQLAKLNRLAKKRRQMRTIGRKNINKVKNLVKQFKDEGLVGIHEITERVIEALPEEVFDTWESARAEIENIVSEEVMKN